MIVLVAGQQESGSAATAQWSQHKNVSTCKGSFWVVLGNTAASRSAVSVTQAASPA